MTLQNKSNCMKKKKKNKNKSKLDHVHQDKAEHDNFWSNTSNTDERQKIREFWLQLGEKERRSLIKVEKEAVLRKMKEQQRHSCNCSVCGKKRLAIEDELEILYDAYYEELEQYTNHQQTMLHTAYLSSDLYDTHDDTDPLDDEDLDEDDDLLDEDDYEEDDDIDNHSPHSFRNDLAVKGSALTVADDLLKNDGKKFLDMMERLAEHRIQKEDQAYYQDEEEEEDAYDDEQDSHTEEQRMEEGRRMFQVFAARMFEQRVLAAYREKVAQERQQRLLEELELEDRQREEKEAKKQKEREKKKDKKRQLKQEQEAKKKAEEEAARLEKEKLLELERKKREQEKQKREQERLRKEEEEKRQKEQERLRKEEEKRRKERKRKEEKERLVKAEHSKVPLSPLSPSPPPVTVSQQVDAPQQPLVQNNSRRSITSIAPIGQRVLNDSIVDMTKQTSFDTNGSFFSSFLFGEPRPMNQSGRFSNDGWTNGWTANSILSESIHDKLFGDALALERVRMAYQKLDEISLFQGYHTLVQLHCIMNNLYVDFPIDIRELYELINSPKSGFQCFNHNQRGMIVLYSQQQSEVQAMYNKLY